MLRLVCFVWHCYHIVRFWSLRMMPQSQIPGYPIPLSVNEFKTFSQDYYPMYFSPNSAFKNLNLLTLRMQSAQVRVFQIWLHCRDCAAHLIEDFVFSIIMETRHCTGLVLAWSGLSRNLQPIGSFKVKFVLD